MPAAAYRGKGAIAAFFQTEGNMDIEMHKKTALEAVSLRQLPAGRGGIFAYFRHQPMIGKTEAAIADNNMIQQIYMQARTEKMERSGQGLILGGGQQRAGRMVMGKYQRSGMVCQRPGDHLSGIDGIDIDRPFAQGFRIRDRRY